MKRFFLTFCLVLIGVLGAQAQTCGNTVALSGCVGACGASYTNYYTVTASDMGGVKQKPFCLTATSNSLCPTDIAKGELSNLTQGTADKALLSQGGTATVMVEEGDVLLIDVFLIPGDPNINCFWLGETHFALVH